MTSFGSYWYGHLGPLPKTWQGNRYILVIGEHFTRWVDAYPIGDETSNIIAEKLVRGFFLHVGISLEIHSEHSTKKDKSRF